MSVWRQRQRQRQNTCDNEDESPQPVWLIQLGDVGNARSLIVDLRVLVVHHDKTSALKHDTINDSTPRQTQWLGSRNG